MIYTLLNILAECICGGESGTWTSTQKRDNQLVTRYFFLGNQPGNLKNVNWRGKIGTEGSQRNKGKKLPEISQNWTWKFFFNCPKFLQNGFFSPGWRLVLPAARSWFWPRPESQVLRADSGRRHRFRHWPGSQVFRSDSGRLISVLAPTREPGFQDWFRSPIPARKRPHFFLKSLL